MHIYNGRTSTECGTGNPTPCQFINPEDIYAAPDTNGFIDNSYLDDGQILLGSPNWNFRGDWLLDDQTVATYTDNTVVHLYADGASAYPYTANYDFRGVNLPTGASAVIYPSAALTSTLTSAASTSGTATVTMAVPPAPPTTSSFVTISGETPIGFNGTYAVTGVLDRERCDERLLHEQHCWTASSGDRLCADQRDLLRRNRQGLDCNAQYASCGRVNHFGRGRNANRLQLQRLCGHGDQPQLPDERLYCV